jgi:hypothetical protein
VVGLGRLSARMRSRHDCWRAMTQAASDIIDRIDCKPANYSSQDDGK